MNLPPLPRPPRRHKRNHDVQRKRPRKEKEEHQHIPTNHQKNNDTIVRAMAMRTRGRWKLQGSGGSGSSKGPFASHPALPYPISSHTSIVLILVRIVVPIVVC